ncbi:Microtubule bundling protein [Microbotryomycetes sp. JL201]|nr:Microtubule bundling protein [Microbotryomycetes sp. JL201]
MTAAAGVEQLISEHLATLDSLCRQITADSCSLKDPLVASVRDAVLKLAEQQTNELKDHIQELRTQLDDKWKRVQDWRTALGEQHVVKARASGANDDEPLSQQLAHADAALDSMRSRMHERGQTIVELHKRLAPFQQSLGNDFFTLELEDVSNGWEKLDLRLERMSSLEREILRCDAEIARRRDELNANVNEIFALRAELGISQPSDAVSGTSSAEEGAAAATAASDAFDEAILAHLGVGDQRERKELLPTTENLARVEAKRKWLEEEKESRNQTIQATYDKLYPLWTMLGVTELEMEQFVNCWMGSTMDVVNARMLSLKRTNMSAFIVREREALTALWDQLFLSQPQRLATFPPFTINIDPTFVWNAQTGVEDEIVNDNVSEELLVAHERERERVEAEVERALPVLERLAKYFNVVEEMRELEASANDKSRLLGKSTRGDPGRLLREEKARKRVAKEKPRLEQELRQIIPAWEQDNQRPFLVNGTRFIDELDMKLEAEATEKENKKRAKAGPAPTGAGPVRTAPLRAQMTGASQQPLKRQMTGRATPAAKRQVPLSTGSASVAGVRVLGEHNGSLTNQRTGGSGSSFGYGRTPVSTSKVAAQMTGRSQVGYGGPGPQATAILQPQVTGMRIPAGWAGTAVAEGAADESVQHVAGLGGFTVGGVQRPSTGGAGFRPRPSMLSTAAGRLM